MWGLDLSQTLQGTGGIGGLVCRVFGGEVRHYFYDANGNVGQLVNPADGAVSARYEYDPFGKAIVADGAEGEGNAVRFSTKYWDEETVLVYYGYRYYSLGLERWTARDPFQEQGGLNLLVFARNNPLTFVDPLGNDYSSYTGSSPEDLDFGGGGSWQSPRKPYMMDPPSPVLPYINAGTQVVAGAVLMVLPDGTITKAGGILLITDGVDKLQALIRGDRTEFEKYLDGFGLSEGEKQAILCLKEFSIITIEVSVVFTKGPVAQRKANFGKANSANYKDTFFKEYPELEGEVIVHYAVEQQTLKRYPGVVSESEIHSLENLRGIPKHINPDVHLSKIRKEWNRFYKQNPNPTKKQLLDKASEIDSKYGSQFKPKIE